MTTRTHSTARGAAAHTYRRFFIALLSAGILILGMTVPALAQAPTAITVPLLPEEQNDLSEPDASSIVEPPFPPTSPAPPSGAAVAPGDTTLRWAARDAGQYPLRYDVGIAADAPPQEATAQNLTEPAYDPGDLEAGTYYWQVYTTDGDMYYIPGDVWNFTVQENGSGISGDSPGPGSIIEPPFPPGSPAPADGAVGVPPDATLTWSSSNSGQYPLLYDIYLGTSPDSLTPVLNGTSETAYQPEALQPGTTYSWQVVATDGDMYYVSGPVWQFTTDG
ncbi:fibronectin type III domain-containing protein [Methanoculleus sp. FWC-SCC1]|uniref:Fibronectin type III domain-containing protein n=1 Tax=Methanoculleus frigidifontis TaxID=2584085 RepID=A0ABT8M911_9EURY|nr:fibronectin type III domain-containing protein [Methanoculleus sp. FWC-SCC1]MDN7024418.1 fibronectin type III domain-containing protein [Methanoculleus sp. FWC-SCC1]